MVAGPVRLWATEESSRVPFSEHDGGCYHLDRDQCCLHTDRRGTYFGEHCVPAAAGQVFTSGRACEPNCWVQGMCGDGINQGSHLTGRCASSEDRDLLHVPAESSSNSTSSSSSAPAASTAAVTTTAMPVWSVTTAAITNPPVPSLNNKEKVIAGAVGGSLGAVALLGGLLGGLLTTTAPPDGTAVLSPTRFLEQGNPAHAMQSATTLRQHLGSIQPWWWAALACSALSVAVCMFLGNSWAQSEGSGRLGARKLTAMHGKLNEEESAETDEEEFSSPQHSQTDTFDLIDANHDGVITREELEAARFSMRTVNVRTAAPVYVTNFGSVPHTPSSTVPPTPLSVSVTQPLPMSP